MHDKCVDDLDVVSVSRLLVRPVGPVGDLQVGPELAKKGDGGPVAQVVVQVVPEAVLQGVRVVGHSARCDSNLREALNLKQPLIFVFVFRLMKMSTEFYPTHL